MGSSESYFDFVTRISQGSVATSLWCDETS